MKGLKALKGISRWFKLDQREYGAASNQDILYGWLQRPESVDDLVKNNLPALRARSRDQVNNNDYARRFINMVKSHVVGPDGFSFQARCADPGGTLDQVAIDTIERGWKRWTMARECDVSERLSFKEIQRLAITTVATDGEVFVIKTKPSDKEFNFSLQLVDPEAVPLTCHDPQKRIYFGIEYNARMRPIALYMKTDPNNSGALYIGGEHYERLPFEDVYHLFLSEKVGQKRGLPWLSTALLRMKMLNGFEDAALVNARVGASKMGFFTTVDGEYTGDGTNAAGETISEVSPGTMETLPAGMDFKSFDPAYPNNEFASFTQRALKGIASGLGVSYHKLANDLEGVNYSSGRLGELEDREIWRGLQDWFCDSFLIPVYEDWLRVQLENGTLRINNNPLRATRIEKYRQVIFQGRRWQWVDPMKEVAAQEKQIELGLRSRSDIIREQGRDPDDVWLEIQQERQKMTDLGIPTEPAQAGFLMGEDNEN